MAESVQQQQLDFEVLAGSSKAAIDPEDYQKKVDEIGLFLAEGKKLSLAKSFEEAAEKYEEAVKTATNHFGHFSHECFQPAFNYGKMLVEVCRMDSQAVNPPHMEGIEEVDEDEEEEGEEEQDVADENGGKMEEEQQNGKKDEEEKLGEAVQQKEEVEGQEKPEAVADELLKGGSDEEVKIQNGQKAEDEAKDGDEEKPAESEEEEAEPDDIETAWEWLEIARKICEKQEMTPHWLECKSDVLVTLGECMTVADEFQQALAEFLNALEIRQKIFPPIDRRIAEVHFFIGLTYSNLDEFDKAAAQYELAKQVLQGAFEATEKELEGAEGQPEKDKLLEEVIELKKLVLSIEDNVRDARDSAEARARQKAMQSELQLMMPETKKLPTTVSSSSSSSDTKAVPIEVNDLSAMIKRKTSKRPLEGASGEKKLEELNGNGTSAGTNGEANGTNKNGTDNAAVLVESHPEQKRIKLSTEEEQGAK